MHANFLFIFFVIASQKTEAIDWLVTQPRTNFGGKQACSGESTFRLNWGWRNAQLWFSCSVMLVIITTHMQSARHLRSDY